MVEKLLLETTNVEAYVENQQKPLATLAKLPAMLAKVVRACSKHVSWLFLAVLVMQDETEETNPKMFSL